jgi:hypothetical protein
LTRCYTRRTLQSGATEGRVEDIVTRLKRTASEADDIPIIVIEELLREAAQTIESLRSRLGVRPDIDLDGIEPEGTG